MALKQLRIGTRASQLALWQANWVKSELEKRYPDMEVTLTRSRPLATRSLMCRWPRLAAKGFSLRKSKRRCFVAKSILPCTA